MGERTEIYDLAAYRRARAAQRSATSGEAAAKSARAADPCGGAWYHEAAIREDARTRRP